MAQQTGIQEKGWGTEYIYALGPSYCGKILHFAKDGRTSFHFHVRKDETLFVQSGDFIIRFINTTNGSREEIHLSHGQVQHVPILRPHQIIAITEGIVLETSSGNDLSDKYRIDEGSTQEQSRRHNVIVEGDLGPAEFTIGDKTPAPTPTLC